MELKTYILVMRDTGFCLIGPFDGEGEVMAWVQENWDDGDPEDPRWQVLEWDGQMPGVHAPGPVAFAMMDSDGEFPSEQEIEEITNAQ